MPKKTRVITFTMPRGNGDEPGLVTGRIEIGAYGIEVFIDGYGSKIMDPGQGGIIFLNHWNGSPQLVVHGDILQESPTHIIQLTTASEDRRDRFDLPEPLHTANPNLQDHRREVTHIFRHYEGRFRLTT